MLWSRCTLFHPSPPSNHDATESFALVELERPRVRWKLNFLSPSVHHSSLPFICHLFICRLSFLMLCPLHPRFSPETNLRTLCLRLELRIKHTANPWRRQPSVSKHPSRPGDRRRIIHLCLIASRVRSGKFKLMSLARICSATSVLIRGSSPFQYEKMTFSFVGVSDCHESID